MAYFQKGDHENALPFLMGAIEVSDAMGLKGTERYAPILAWLGSCLARGRDKKEAARVMEEAKMMWDTLQLRHTLGYARLLGDLGRLYIDMGYLERAMDYLTVAVELKMALSDEGVDVSQLDPKSENEVQLAALRKSLGKHVLQKELQARYLQRVLKEHRELRDRETKAREAYAAELRAGKK